MIAKLQSELEKVQDLRHVARQLTWFQKYFRKHADEFGGKYNLTIGITDRRLAEAFLKWTNAFENSRADAHLDYTDFTVFSGGLMLRELLRVKPVSTKAIESIAECIPLDPMASICRFWPEGLLYTDACMAVVSAILKSEFNADLERSPYYTELRFWESFRENVREDVGLAVPFFDAILGREPNWTFPEYFRSRPGLRSPVPGVLQKRQSRPRLLGVEEVV